MANTDVTLINNDGAYIPSVASVPIIAGDTVSFSTDDGSSALAYFSPAAISILSPKPVNPVTIATAGKAVFSFSSASPGAYSVFFAADASGAPGSFPDQSSQVLLLEFAAPVQPPPFDNPLTSGH